MDTFIAAYLWLLVLSFTPRKPAPPRPITLRWFGIAPRLSDRVGDFKPKQVWLDETTCALVFPKPVLTRRRATRTCSRVEHTFHPLLPSGNCRPELN